MPSARKRVLIAGAGIGGLTLAHALRAQGHDVEIFERAAELLPLGAGITVQANAMLALRTLGLDARVLAAGNAFTAADILAPDGRVLSCLPVESVSGPLGAPMIAIDRGKLQRALLEGLELHVRTGREVIAAREEGDEVVLAFADGSAARGDLVVGADGLHSALRRHVLGDAPARYAGYTSWRGVCALPVPAERTTETWGAGERFGVVPIGGGEVYWFAVADAPSGVRAAPEAEKRELLERFGSWHAPCRALIEATPASAILRTDVFDRAPVQRWSRGRVTLLGDAAHPMTPNLGQGGCQAIEDAVVLARSLAAHGGIADALAAYERARVPRANRFVADSRRMGQVAQWRNPVARWARTALLRATPASRMAERMRGLLAFE